MKTGIPPPSYGSLYNVGKRALPLLESEIKKIPIYSKTGKFIGYKQLFRHPLGQFETPLPKKWIEKLAKKKTKFLFDTKATMPIYPRQITIPISKDIKFKPFLYRHLYQKLVFPIPSHLTMYASLPLVGLKKLYGTTMKKVETIKLPSIQKISIQTPIATPIQLPIVSPILKTKISLKTISKSISKPPVQITKPVTTVKPSVAKPVVSEGIPKPFFPFLFPEYPKKGRVFIDWIDVFERYKFREFKIPALFKGVKI